MPRDADPAVVVGRYILNLVPRLFTLTATSSRRSGDLVPAEPLDEILADYDTPGSPSGPGSRPPRGHRTAAWQFASPVRWIETQDLLFTEEAAGGVGIERRFVEIGVRSAPRSPDWPETPRDCPNSPATQSKCSMPSATPRCCSPPTRTRLRSPSPRSGPHRPASPPRWRRPRRHTGRADRCPRLRAPRRHRVRRRRRHPGADRAVGQDAHRPDRAAGLHRVHHRRRLVATQPAAGGSGLRAQPRGHRRKAPRRTWLLRRTGHQAGPHLQPFGPVLTDAVNDQLRSSLVRRASVRAPSPSA